MPRTSPLARSLCLAALLALPSLGAFADAPSRPAPKHSDVTEPQRGSGEKWAVDDALLLSMGRIAQAVDKGLATGRAGKASAGGYDALAMRVRHEVAAIARSSHVEPMAEEQLQLVLSELKEGADMLEGKREGVERRDGLAKLVHALESYARHFHHPDWQAPSLDR